MKKYSLLLMTTALFAACTTSDVADTAPEQLAGNRSGEYVCVGISLPSTTGTRSWSENEDPYLDDGLTTEYNIQNALLLVFCGEDEASAKLAQVETLDFQAQDIDDDPNQLTVNSRHSLRINSVGNYVGILAVLNGAGTIERQSDREILVNGATVMADCTVGDLQAAISEARSDGSPRFIYADGNNRYFFMTNAVLSSTRGGTVDPTQNPGISVLAEVDMTKLYETAEDALVGDVAADIHVERGVAKVTLMEGAQFMQIADGWKKGTADYYSAGVFDGWCLDNTNLQSYVVRRVDMPEQDFAWNLFNPKSADDKYRFIGDTPVDGFYLTHNAYRTYWCKDPNYDVAYDAANFYAPAAKAFSPLVEPLYCYENTFDVAHQTYPNTTRAVIAVTLNGGQDYYTVNGDRHTLYEETDVRKLVLAALTGQTAFRTWCNANCKGEVTVNDLALSFSSDAPGETQVSEITVPGELTKDGQPFNFNDDTEALAGVVAAVNKQISLCHYVGGRTYYVVRIKHFGDELTPWNKGESATSPSGTGISTIYPGLSAANYLGRYGMVRNNWYVLGLNRLLKIGYAEVPDLTIEIPNDDTSPDTPDTPDNPDTPDVEKGFIEEMIIIRPWALRSQSWQLKSKP